MGDDLGWKNIEKHGERAVAEKYQHDKGKEVREETINFYF